MGARLCRSSQLFLSEQEGYPSNPWRSRCHGDGKARHPHRDQWSELTDPRNEQIDPAESGTTDKAECLGCCWKKAAALESQEGISEQDPALRFRFAQSILSAHNPDNYIDRSSQKDQLRILRSLPHGGREWQYDCRAWETYQDTCWLQQAQGRLYQMAKATGEEKELFPRGASCWDYNMQGSWKMSEGSQSWQWDGQLEKVEKGTGILLQEGVLWWAWDTVAEGKDSYVGVDKEGIHQNRGKLSIRQFIFTQ